MTVVETKRGMKLPKHMIVELKRSEMANSTSGSGKNDQEAIFRPYIKVSFHKYELYAIVNYDGGRYNADIKCEDEIWRRFNDRSVPESPLNSVFISESSTLGSSEACLLVYRHREQTAGVTGEDQRREDPRSLEASKVTQPEAAAKSQKTQDPRGEQSLSMNTKKIDSTDMRRRYCGLENQGSCCLNAVLQTLFMTKEFREHVNRLDRDGVSSDGNLAEELNKLFNKLETQEKNAVSAAEIMKILGITDVHKRDAAELLRLILDKTPGSSELFKDTMKTTRTCRSCRDKPDQIPEDFLSFLSIQNSQDVEHVLQAYAGGNKRVDSVYCDRCRRKMDTDTKTEMIEFPEHMIVELKRSETSTYSSSFSKNEAIIRPHIKVSCHEYELYAVVNYSKTLTIAGRYNADIKCEDEIWRRFDDLNVSQSPLNSVFINESSTLRSSDPCLLVYKHREQTAGDTGEDHSTRSCDLTLTHLPQTSCSSLRKKSDQQSQLQTEAQHQGLEAHQERLITQVLEAVHGVTREEAAVTLYENQWNFTISVQQLKVDQLYRMTQSSREECKQTLISFHWDLQGALSVLPSLKSKRTLL